MQRRVVVLLIILWAAFFVPGVTQSQTLAADVVNAVTQQHATLRQFLHTAAQRHGVPIRVAEALVKRESGWNPRATGRAGEIGLGQIKLGTARAMGYRGTRQGLYNPQINLNYSMRYAAGALRACRTIKCYQTGY